MKASELRSGVSWVELTDNSVNVLNEEGVRNINKYKKVVSTDSDLNEVVLKFNDVNFDFDMSGIKPIPLTEDILVKCGFEKLAPNDFYDRLFRLENFYFSLDAMSAVIGWEDYYDHHKNIGECDCLDQLQNLFFCLTGEELNIEL